jgi:hypothetical protein
LFITITSGDLHDPCLEGLNRVARTGDEHEHNRVGMVDDVDLALADAHGLDEHGVVAGRVHQQRGLDRRLGESAERPPRGHRPYEHLRIEEVRGQPDPVAKQRAAAEG